MKRSNQGFTLIELIIVIVILGILAVTASPKFLDLSEDARVSTVNGLEGNISGAANIVYSRAILDGNIDTNDSSDSVTIGGQTVSLVFGYPDAQTLDLAVEIDTANDWDVVEGDTIVRIYPNDDSITPHTVSGDTFSGANASDCYIQYTESTAEGVAPVIAPVVTGC